NLPASILLTIHLPMHSRSSLDEILTRAGPLPACFAKDGDILRKSHIYIAPPDRHLVVDGDRISLGEGPRENNARPAIDPMARSAAVWCGSRTVGVVLTGTLGDGASGLWTIRQSGGITVVQDPKDAAYSEMPLTALNRAKPDHIAQLKDMPALLTSLAHEPAGETKALPRSAHYEVEVARTGRGDMDQMDKFGRRSVLACPGLRWRDVGTRRRRSVALPLSRRSHLHGRSDESCARRQFAPCARECSTGARGAHRAGAKTIPSGKKQRSSPARGNLGGKDERVRARVRDHPQFDAPYGPSCRAGRFG